MAAPYPETPAALRQFQANYPAREYPKKARVHVPGEGSESIYLLVSGIAKISKISNTKQPLLTLVHTGELWGESLIGNANQASTSLETATKAHIHRFPATEFHRAAIRDAELMAWVAGRIGQRLLKLERQLELMHAYRVEQRLLLTLADLASSDGGHHEAEELIEIPLTQGELASLVGATRETTSTILNLFERKGWIELRRGAMYVASADALRRVSEAP